MKYMIMVLALALTACGSIQKNDYNNLTVDEQRSVCSQVLKTLSAKYKVKGDTGEVEALLERSEELEISSATEVDLSGTVVSQSVVDTCYNL